MSTETKYRTITLTDRPPVKIKEDDWPVIASADGDSDSGADPSRWRQRRNQGELDTYVIKVRRHADGRTLVYAVLDAAIAPWHQPAGGESRREGVLLTSARESQTIVDAIKIVAEDCGIPRSVVAECIADLPAEEI